MKDDALETLYVLALTSGISKGKQPLEGGGRLRSTIEEEYIASQRALHSFAAKGRHA